MKNPLYRAIQKRAQQLFTIYRTRGFIRDLTGPCQHCGLEEDGWSFCFEHRDYNDTLNVGRACYSCNKKLGPAKITIIDPDSLIESAVSP